MCIRLLVFTCLLFLSWNLQAQFPCFPGEIRVANDFEASFCDDGVGPNVIRFRSKPAALPRAYLVVNVDNVIVYIGASGRIDFTGLGVGLRVYSFTLAGSIRGRVGDVLGTTELASGCYALSTNFIEIDNNGGQEGGTLTGGPFAFCVGDGIDDILTFSSSGTFGDPQNRCGLQPTTI
ncbi:MAG: hypothetical protein DA408_18960 [Bacteroidetes bacterium]|nr:MAG: hypothetical protein DA408_18960 [Bacteroidota bacterium]